MGPPGAHGAPWFPSLPNLPIFLWAPLGHMAGLRFKRTPAIIALVPGPGSWALVPWSRALGPVPWSRALSPVPWSRSLGPEPWARSLGPGPLVPGPGPGPMVPGPGPGPLVLGPGPWSQGSRGPWALIPRGPSGLPIHPGMQGPKGAQRPPQGRDNKPPPAWGCLSFPTPLLIRPGG